MIDKINKEILTHQKTQQLNHLAEQLVTYWDINLKSIQLIQGGEMALVWKIETDQGPVCLKRLHRREKKALFSIHAQVYLRKKGVRVPKIIPTKRNQLYTKVDSFLFVLYEWIEGVHLTTNHDKDLETLIRGLANYHQSSVGYEAPQGVSIFSKLGKWPDHYLKRCQQLESWKNFATATPNDPFSQLYLKEIDEFISSGKDTIKELLHSAYVSIVEDTKKAPNLCHPDYGTGNTLLGNDGHFWIIDLDTTCYDLQIRDIRMFLFSTLDDGVVWDEGLFNKMIRYYQLEAPITEKSKEIMLIDLQFPYELYKLVENKYIQKSNIEAVELEEAMEFERLRKKELRGLLL